MQTRFKAFGFVLVLLLLTLLSTGTGRAAQITGNFTIASHYSITSNLNYSGWIIIEAGGTLNLSNYLVQAKGIILENGSTLYVTKGSNLLHILYLYNNGTIDYAKNSLNSSFLLNYGKIVHQNWLADYSNLPFSYGGSGGGGGTNGGTSTTYATEGLSTRVSGGAPGNDPAGAGSQAPLLGNLSSPIFNESVLSGASGGNASCDAGSQGAYGFIINTSTFENFGFVYNQGEAGAIPCYNSEYYGGGGGAGGGGVLEIIFSASYLNKGVYNLSGGGLNADFNGANTYGGWGGKGGAGQLIVVKLGQSSTTNQNSSSTTKSSNTSSSMSVSEFNYINQTLLNLTSEIIKYQTEISSYQGELLSLNKSYNGIKTSLVGLNNTLSSQIATLNYQNEILALNKSYSGVELELISLNNTFLDRIEPALIGFNYTLYNHLSGLNITLYSLAAKTGTYQNEILNISSYYGGIQPALSDIYDKEGLIQNQTILGYGEYANETDELSNLSNYYSTIRSAVFNISSEEDYIQNQTEFSYSTYNSEASNISDYEGGIQTLLSKVYGGENSLQNQTTLDYQAYMDSVSVLNSEIDGGFSNLTSGSGYYQKEISSLYGDYDSISPLVAEIYSQGEDLENQYASLYGSYQNETGVVQAEYNNIQVSLDNLQNQTDELASVKYPNSSDQNIVSNNYNQYNFETINNSLLTGLFRQENNSIGFIINLLESENLSEPPFIISTKLPVASITGNSSYSLTERNQSGNKDGKSQSNSSQGLLSALYSSFLQVVTFIPGAVSKII